MCFVHTDALFVNMWAYVQGCERRSALNRPRRRISEKGQRVAHTCISKRLERGAAKLHVFLAHTCPPVTPSPSRLRLSHFALVHSTCWGARQVHLQFFEINSCVSDGDSAEKGREDTFMERGKGCERSSDSPIYHHRIVLRNRRSCRHPRND
ncbi:hypothetical protein M5D96_001406 [Drosophila gunungcola]|uniref:Uncharacterized protein n=1 Tax=Drosophila gunungcola TaxID=103775 RepID=A0A9P9YY47_9MUSC|nr:hypothetical protein M5D96_001406 [Drosophila gunungcola]